MAEDKYPGMTAEQKKAYQAALRHEQEGYEARQVAAKESGDSDAEKLVGNRIKQVQAELKRVGSVRPAKRAEKRGGDEGESADE